MLLVKLVPPQAEMLFYCDSAVGVGGPTDREWFTAGVVYEGISDERSSLNVGTAASGYD